MHPLDQIAGYLSNDQNGSTGIVGLEDIDFRSSTAINITCITNNIEVYVEGNIAGSTIAGSGNSSSTNEQTVSLISQIRKLLEKHEIKHASQISDCLDTINDNLKVDKKPSRRALKRLQRLCKNCQPLAELAGALIGSIMATYAKLSS